MGTQSKMLLTRLLSTLSLARNTRSLVVLSNRNIYSSCSGGGRRYHKHNGYSRGDGGNDNSYISSYNNTCSRHNRYSYGSAGSNYCSQASKDDENQNEQQQISHENGTHCGETVHSNKVQKSLDELEQELSKIVGLEKLKLQLRTFAKGMTMDAKRRGLGIELGPRRPPHMVFLGNPGTGKTTVARILGKLLCSLEVLSSDKVIEVQRSDLVGQCTGETAITTKAKIDEAMGGVLFVDEAYRLAPVDSKKDYGVEAMEEIMSVLEDGKIVVIFAGYNEPMKRIFSTNEGFTRRVTKYFQFDDYTSNDLAEMLMIKMSKQNEKSRLYGFKLDSSCTLEAVRALIEKNSSEKLRSKLNGGLVDHMLNNARENLDSRLNIDSKEEEMVTITLQDLEAGVQLLSNQVKVECKFKSWKDLPFVRLLH